MGYFDRTVGYGYGRYTYTHGNKKFNVRIYRTNPSTEYIAPAVSETAVSMSSMNPTQTTNVAAKINGNYRDYDGEKSFYGIFYNNKILSKDGKINVKLTDANINYGIEDGGASASYGWYRYSPSMCIKADGTATIKWIVGNKTTSTRTTLQEAMANYSTIVAGQHCLVYQGKSCYETSPLLSSYEGVTIADYNNLSNAWNHHNEELGGRNGKIRRRRAFLGYATNKSFYLVVVEGQIDWGDPDDTGMNMQDAGRLMVDMGCQFALNMDGGSPTQMRVAGNSSAEYPDPKKENALKVGSVICVCKK